MDRMVARRPASSPKTLSQLLTVDGFECLDVLIDHGQLCHSQDCHGQTGLARRPHCHVHFTPTSASLINQVRRWFEEPTRKRLRRGVRTSIYQLDTDIRAFIERHNQNLKPYKWTKSADEILTSVKRFCQKTDRHMRRTLDSHHYVTATLIVRPE